VLLPALLAAIAAGVVVTVLQQIFLEPLILEAQSAESGADLQVAAGPGVQPAALALLFNCPGAFGLALPCLRTGCALSSWLRRRSRPAWG
jgi:hypothetical protein